MGDFAEISQAMGAYRQAKHAQWFAENMATLRASSLPFAERSTAVLFREPGMPAVDFYPHTGRWRVVRVKGGQGHQRTLRGGARSFLRWYEKHRTPRTDADR